MLFLITLLSGFICFWAWAQFQNFSGKALVPVKFKWLPHFIPWFASALLIYLNWIFIAGFAFILWVISKWLKKEKLSNHVLVIGSLAVLSMGFEFFLQKLSLTTRMPEPEMWVFWLGETRWVGVLIGFAAGLIIQAMMREKGHAWWLAPALLVSGVGSLGLAWGLFLGDRCHFNRLYSTIFSLVGVFIGILLMGSYLPQFKLQYWLIACLVWIWAEIPVFHRQAKN